jgi:hypothetical protein
VVPTADVPHFRQVEGGEGLLIDCGAVSNLCGDKWARHTSEAASRAGHGSSYALLDKPINIGGVGKGDQQATTAISVPVAFESGCKSVFVSPIVPDSELPALLGLELIDAHGMLIDSRHRRLIIPGPGGYKIILSPNSHSLVLKKAMLGHLLLPCTQWRNLKANAPNIMMP